MALFSPLVSGVSDGSALTVIVSLTPPTFSGIVRSDRLSPACSSMPVNSVLPKPDSSITTVYVAAGTAENEKNPSSFVTVTRRSPDASLVSVTVAPGRTPPLPSVTVPLRSPVNRCANAGAAVSARSAWRR